MAFTPAACVTALAAYLNTVAGIGGGAGGQVHTRRRIVRTEADVKALMADPNGKVNAWMIYPAAATTTVTERGPGFKAIGQSGGGRVLTTLQFAVDAYYQIDDAAGSEETFRDLAFAVMNGLNHYGSLNIDGVTLQLPADIEQFGFTLFAGLGLYHSARIGCGWRGQTQ